MTFSTTTPVPDPQTRVTPPTTSSPWRLVLFPARAFLALGWIRAGVEKLIDQSWWSGDYLAHFLAEHEMAMLSFLLPLTRFVTDDTSALLSLVVLAAELTIGVCLLRARWLRPTLWAASGLNIAFIALGAVSPSAFYLVIQLTLLLEIAARRPTQSRQSLIAIATCWIAAALMVPFIRTVHPHDVIEDPAIMLATVAALTAATLTVRRVEHRSAH